VLQRVRHQVVQHALHVDQRDLQSLREPWAYTELYRVLAIGGQFSMSVQEGTDQTLRLDLLRLLSDVHALSAFELESQVLQQFLHLMALRSNLCLLLRSTLVFITQNIKNCRYRVFQVVKNFVNLYVFLLVILFVQFLKHRIKLNLQDHRQS